MLLPGAFWKWNYFSLWKSGKSIFEYRAKCGTKSLLKINFSKSNSDGWDGWGRDWKRKICRLNGDWLSARNKKHIGREAIERKYRMQALSCLNLMHLFGTRDARRKKATILRREIYLEFERNLHWNHFRCRKKLYQCSSIQTKKLKIKIKTFSRSWL